MEVGETLGAYRLVEQLGQGGMATVFKAHHAALDRYVAIKVLHPAFKGDPNFLARFQREARVVARLEHPNIVPVYDFAEHQGAPFLVMKFVEGETLKARLQRGPLPAQDILQCVEAVGAALDYAHRQGILHRDVKPSNVMLARDGAIYLADFGLARIVLAGETTLSTDSLLGTPYYMSPEQAAGVKDLDTATDQYALGVVIYELLTGRVPFSADTPFAVIHDHIFTPLPAPRSINPNIPAAAEAVLLKALAKRPGERYPSVRELVAELRAALAGYAAEAAANGAPAPIAPARSVPLAPDAVTPPAARTQIDEPPAPAAAAAAGSASAPTVAMPAPATVEPTVMAARPPEVTVAAPTAVRPSPPAIEPAPEPAAQVRPRAYSFRGWHAAIAAGVAGCVLLGAFAAARPGRRAAALTATAAVLAEQPLATEEATLSAEPQATPGLDAAAYLAEAERAFRAGQAEAGLNNLDYAVAAAPGDIGVLRQAGDLAVGAGLGQAALERYYLKAVSSAGTLPADDQAELQANLGLAFYLAAAEPEADAFLQAQMERFPEQPMPALAWQRYRVFFAPEPEVARALQAFLEANPNHAAALLVLGDYHLAAGEIDDARAQYRRVADVRPGNLRNPNWIEQEARCHLQKLLEAGAAASLEASCVEPSSLLIGR